MKSPASDPGFASSPLHGQRAQEVIIRKVFRHLKRFGQAIDVGAHVGTWTLPLAMEFGEVIALEPVQENFECLEANLKGRYNVTPLRMAAGAVVGQVRMRNPGDNSGTWCIGNEGEVVDMIQLDLLSATADFVKLDVEGAEGLVLEGARRLLAANKPAVFFEDNGLGERHYGAAWIDPKSVLREFGYHPVIRYAKNELWMHS